MPLIPTANTHLDAVQKVVELIGECMRVISNNALDNLLSTFLLQSVRPKIPSTRVG